MDWKTPMLPPAFSGDYRPGPLFHDQGKNHIVPPGSDFQLTARLSSPVPWSRLSKGDWAVSSPYSWSTLQKGEKGRTTTQSTTPVALYPSSQSHNDVSCTAALQKEPKDEWTDPQILWVCFLCLPSILLLYIIHFKSACPILSSRQSRLSLRGHIKSSNSLIFLHLAEFSLLIVIL